MITVKRAFSSSILLLTLGSTAGSGLGTAHAAPPQVREVLSRSKQAAGGDAWDTVATLHTRFKAELGGLSGSGETWDDVRSGRSYSSIDLGPVKAAQGFDGKTSWVQDASGQTRLQDGAEAREAEANEAYRRVRAFWYPERWPATVEPGGEQTEGERRFHVVRIRPEGGRPFELWIDAATWLVDRVVEKGSVDTTTTLLSDYREVQGLKLPFASRITNGETRYDQLVTVESVEVNAALDEARFQKPAARVDDFAIAEGRTSTVVPFELLNNHIYVTVRLNGGEPLRFLFDTGGVNVVTPATAKELGLEVQGRLQGRGAGEKSEDVGLTRVQELRVGDVTLRDQVFYVLPMAGLEEAEGVEVDGLIGYEVFKRFVVRIDYAGSLLTFTLPAAFRETGAGTAVPFTFDGQTPQVQGELDGVPGTFSIDTGSRASLTLTAPFAREHGLEAKYAPRFEAMSGWGVGGGVRSAMTRAKVLKLGSVEVPGPVTDIARSEKGAFADRYDAGNVGGGVLRRFTVTFDYPNQRLYLEPNAAFPRPDSYDRAGLWLNRAGAELEVKDVVAGGPAAEAGLKAGDRIVAVDGTSAAEIRLPDLRVRLRTEKPGTPVRLTVRTGEATREATVVLRDLV